jgi:hypothetical protein
VWGSNHTIGGQAPSEGNAICGYPSGISINGSSNLVAHNEIYGNTGHGITVNGATSLYNTLTHNSIHSNGGMGIDLRGGGNAELDAPVITGVDPVADTVTGTACPYCTVEVFSDCEDEGRLFEGTTEASDSGDFVFSKGSALTGPSITATCTDLDGNTSEFSSVSLDLAATVDIKPDTLNLRNQRRWVTVYIELPEGYDVGDIAIDTVVLEGAIAAETSPTAVDDYDGDDVSDLMVKFSRQQLVEHLGYTTGGVSLAVSGELSNGTPFEGSDTITVIAPAGL